MWIPGNKVWDEEAVKDFLNCITLRQKIMEFGSTQLIKESVKSGIGISLLSKWAIGMKKRTVPSGRFRIRAPLNEHFLLLPTRCTRQGH